MENSHNEKELQSEATSWYALRTFNCQEKKISRFLTEKGCVHFIPMKIEQTEDEPPKKIQVPAIHNLLFVQKQGSPKEMLQLLQECNIPNCFFRHPGGNRICEIPDAEMVEFRMLCDPDFHTQSVFITQGEAEVMIGKEVRVTKGPFKGAVGRLVRKQKQYYFLKAIIGMGVMVRISRWYCEPL